MPDLLPWSILLVTVLLVVAMPWRRSDPHHEFMSELCRRLKRGEASTPDALGSDEANPRDHWFFTTDVHRSGRAHV